MKEIREALKKFCDREVVPRREDMDRNPELCRTLMRQLGDLGFLCPGLPERFGGMDLSDRDCALLFQELVHANPSLALSASAHAILCAHAIHAFGSEEQRARYLPKLARGEWIGAWAVTEPQGGSDVRSMRAVAKPRGTGFHLTGNKTFITNAPIADVVVVYVKVDESSSERISAFILEKGMPGVALSKPMAKFGMEGSPTGDVFIDNVEVGPSQLLGKPGTGFDQIVAEFNLERAYSVSAAAAVMRHCLATALGYAAERRAFGHAILEFQAVQFKISRIYAQLAMTEAALNDLFQSPEAADFYMRVSAAKIFSSKWAIESCLDTMQVLGGLGYTRETDIERFLRDAKLLEIGAGTTDMQHLVIVRGLMKSLDPPRSAPDP